ncbi:MAG: hypothetical protein ACSHX8_07150 [Opitutaceae bacterium]
MSENAIGNLICINSRFLRSAQLERDFHDPESISGYCVTTETTRHLKRISNAFRAESSNRAWRITGDFGSGKSSFALVLANLLSRPSKTLPSSIRPLRNDLGLARNSPKLLPILITGTREQLSQAVLRAILEALEKSVDGRRQLQSKSRIEELLKATTVEDRKAILAIEAVTRELVKKDLFGGIVLIIDELGKFLEYAALNPERQDVYFLQSLGEAATRSGTNAITVVGLLHQGFAAYADKLSDSSQREWEKVAGRYEELVFNQPLNQIALLLANALQVDIETAPRGWKTRAQKDMAEAVDLGIFGSDAGKMALREVAASLYPLHATVLPVLAKFFRRFGQNERSLFSFLLSSEPHALQDFSTREATLENIYRLSNFYDFAAHNFDHRLSSQSFRSHWSHIDAVVCSSVNEDDLTQDILKTIGILNVIESSELAPSRELIALSLGHPEGLDEKLASLQKRGLLFARGKRGYALWANTSINLEQAYQESIEKIKKAPPIASIVQNRLDVRPVVARRHYIQHGNLRHSSVQFVTVNEFAQIARKEAPYYSHPADGHILIVLCESHDQRQQAVETATSLPADCDILVAISPPLDVLTGAALDLERWHHVERYTTELKDDRFAAEEVSRQIAIASKLLDTRLEEYVGFRRQATGDMESLISWYTQGKPVNSLNQGQPLQNYLSEHFDTIFHSAPQVSNELINRQTISSAAAGGRQQLFHRLLNQSDTPLLGLPEGKAPPEKSIYLSVLRASGVHAEHEDGWRIQLPPEEEDPRCIRPALVAIIQMLEEQPDAKIRLDQIRDRLRQPPYGVRDGLIPLFFAIALKLFESEIAVYEDGVFQADIEENLMMRLGKRPETFEFQLCRIAGIRRELLVEFANIIESSEAAPATLLAIVRPLCLFIDGLPDYTKHTDDLTKEAIALRKAINTAREPANLVFKAIPKALGIKELGTNQEDARKLSKALELTLRELRRAFAELQNRMAEQILTIAERSDSELTTWRSEQAEVAEQLVVEVTDPELRAFCMKLIDDQSPEADWLESLGSFLTRCPPSKWNDKNEIEFGNRFTELLGKFNRVHSTCFNKGKKLSENSIRLAITGRDGQEHDHVVRMSRKDTQHIEQLEQRINEIISEQPELALTTLTKILWDKLKEKQ